MPVYTYHNIMYELSIIHGKDTKQKMNAIINPNEIVG